MEGRRRRCQPAKGLNVPLSRIERTGVAQARVGHFDRGLNDLVLSGPDNDGFAADSVSHRAPSARIAGASRGSGIADWGGGIADRGWPTAGGSMRFPR